MYSIVCVLVLSRDSYTGVHFPLKCQDLFEKKTKEEMMGNLSPRSGESLRLKQHGSFSPGSRLAFQVKPR